MENSMATVFVSLLEGISVTHVVQGIIIGAVLAFITSQLLGRTKSQEGQRLAHHVRIRRAGQWHVAASRVLSNISRPRKRTARGDVLDDERRWCGQLHHALPAGRSSAQRCILVADHE